MLTIEGLISVLGLCLTCFGLGDTPSEARIIINHKNSRPSLENLAAIFANMKSD